MIKAAFFDIDGTLLSHKTKQVPQSTRDAIQKLQEAGILCLVATGRHICQFEHLPVDDIPFDGYLMLNGQICLDRDRKVLYGFPLEGKSKETVLRMFHEKEQPILLVEEDCLYLNLLNDRVRYVQDCISSPVAEVKAYSGKPLYMGIAYIGPEEEDLLAEIRQDCVITRWNPYAVDMIAKGGGKDEAIRRYLEATGIRQEETIAFGDGFNDMQMLSFAGIGVAMGNAEEEVKALADYVTADVDDDGIEKALKHFGIL